MTAAEKIRNIKTALEQDVDDDVKIDTIELILKERKIKHPVVRLAAIEDELMSFDIQRPEYLKMKERIFPFLESLKKIKGTPFNVYYYHYLTMWIICKGRGAEDSKTSKLIHKKAKSRWPKGLNDRPLPNPKGTIRMFKQLCDKFNSFELTIK